VIACNTLSNLGIESWTRPKRRLRGPRCLGSFTKKEAKACIGAQTAQVRQFNHKNDGGKCSKKCRSIGTGISGLHEIKREEKKWEKGDWASRHLLQSREGKEEGAYSNIDQAKDLGAVIQGLRPNRERG